ncbi:NAD(P)-dependent dehydrogenase, short-chain alcohol dehydrogenase family [Sulfobacillus thermosulfidooxidans DSM 9293]|uniref:NAD(P)-dependent dehydrogenase, short-chain alcohol dehydrogenase family n=1 Tax=Sulfobacillus thermosulfidooxidans (strain DSM 9293 / VKM B-1269 / AT-1) TaxID=929705 RepID=A0A1W1W8G4_SULTA|nr:SDR family oxidoreductase [Sulfobacillus thermosulfidooxidans]SMC02578.1 NAD(P)-dependent dehydrogenase, short-chain alcohol dehydrogenase family [Sulfobacillus thermosulfidooxidans DSM 9293]
MNNPSPVLLATGLTGAIGQALVALMYPSWHIIGIRRSPVNVNTSIECEWIEADLSDYDTLARRVEQALLDRHITRINGFVHVAGVVYSDDIVHTTGFEWEKTLNVNLRAAFELVKVVKPFLFSPASIVFVSSVDALMASTLGPAAAYGASKAGLEGLMRHLAVEWGHEGIRVNSVMVGALREGMGVADPQEAHGLSEHTALGRLGWAKEVAPAIQFLLEEHLSSYITGHTLRVDGGLNLAY